LGQGKVRLGQQEEKGKERRREIWPKENRKGEEFSLFAKMIWRERKKKLRWVVTNLIWFTSGDLKWDQRGRRFEKGIWKRVQNGLKEFETYSNEKIEKGFASPWR
jgi:hypothetical protein